MDPLEQDEQLLTSLKPVWPSIARYVSEALERAKSALIDAKDTDTIRLLQGRALVYRDLLNLPNSLAAAIAEQRLARVRREDES